MHLQIFSFLITLTLINAAKVDEKGYVIYCPCMGRFGNQVDQTLGAINFVKILDRTLVLPPFIDFTTPGKAGMIPFEDIYQPSYLARHLKVITLKEFKHEIMPKIWPREKRISFCWNPRDAFYDKKAAPGCHAKDGNPFGPFWDYVGIEFVGDEYFGDIEGGYDLSVSNSKKHWLEKYPASQYPVLAFTGAPSFFPSKRKDWEIQAYLRWNSKILYSARKFINQTLTRPFVGIHLRTNVDWDSVCEHVHSDRKDNIFASAQCLPDAPEKGDFSKELCKPSKETVVEAVRFIFSQNAKIKVVDKVGKIGAKSVFVTSDKDFMISALTEALNAYDITVHTLKKEDPFIALAILQESDHFIGNCISTFSAIVTRHRQFAFAKSRPSSFFGHKPRVSEYVPSRKIEL